MSFPRLCLAYAESAAAQPANPASIPPALIDAVAAGRDGFDAAALAALSAWVGASFVPSNSDELGGLLDSMDDLAPDVVEVTAARLEAGRLLPVIDVQAEFRVPFSQPLDDDDLAEWQEAHDVYLRTDCVSFWWDLGEGRVEVLDDCGGGFDLLDDD